MMPGCSESTTISCPNSRQINIETIMWGFSNYPDLCTMNYVICPLQADQDRISIIEIDCNGRSSCTLMFDVPFRTICGNGALESAEIFYTCRDGTETGNHSNIMY